MLHYSDADVREAVKLIDRFHRTVLCVNGINWREEWDESKCATDYESVVSNMLQAEGYGDVPYTVYAGASDTSIYAKYGSIEDNWRFRVVHDYYHTYFQKDFSVDGEYQLGHLHAGFVYRYCRERGVSEHLSQLAWLLMLCDTAGQTYYYDRTGGGFVENQAEFVENMIDRCMCTLLRDLTPLAWEHNFRQRFEWTMAKCQMEM